MAGFAVLLMAWLGSPAHAASFAGKRAGTKIEKMICGDRNLSDMDEELGVLYAREDDAPTNDPRGVAQRTWIAKRNACTTAACVENQYHVRLSQLACDPDGPYSGSKHEETGCLNHQLWVLEPELDVVERQHTDDIAKAAHGSAEVMPEFAVEEAKAWRAYRKAKCGLYGNREGDGGIRQAFWALTCDVGDTKNRTKELKDDPGP